MNCCGIFCNPQKGSEAERKVCRHSSASRRLSHIRYVPFLRGFTAPRVFAGTRCISLGEKLCATPDGRMAGESFSKNFSGTAGQETEGLTAAMLSALTIDQTEFADAGVLDFIAHPSALEGKAGLDAMVTMAEVYLTNGGFALQGNVLQLEQLKDAKQHPENYPNLQVRVCGWNEYFVNMSEEAQDAFIKRLEAI